MPMMRSWGSRSGDLAQGTARATAGGRTGTAPGEDPTDGVREIRRTQPEEERGRQACDVRFTGIHPHVWEDPDNRALHREAEDDRQADARETAGNPAEVAATHARCGSGDGEVAAVGRAGLLQLSRASRQRETVSSVPRCGYPVLAADVAPVAVSIGSAWTVWCARWIPSVRISHPYPSVRFDAIHPR